MLTAAGAATERALARREGAAARLPENADAGSACTAGRRRVSCGGAGTGEQRAVALSGDRVADREKNGRRTTPRRAHGVAHKNRRAGVADRGDEGSRSEERLGRSHEGCGDLCCVSGAALCLEKENPRAIYFSQGSKVKDYFEREKPRTLFTCIRDMPAKTPVAKATAGKPSTAKQTPKSPSLSLNDDTGNIASSKKQLNFKTPAAKAAGAQASSASKKRPLTIQEEEEPATKKGRTPAKVSKKDAPSWKELEAAAAAERASAAKSSSLKLSNPKARSPKELLVEEARSLQKKTPSPRMTRGQRQAAAAVTGKKATPPRRELPPKAATTGKKGKASKLMEIEQEEEGEEEDEEKE